MRTTESKTSVAGKITDKAREVTDSDKKLSDLFFGLIDKPMSYLKTVLRIIKK